MKKYFLFLFVALLATTIFTSCSDDNDEEISDQTMVAGTTKNIGNAEWTSSNKYIASVEGSLLTANRVGTASITSELGSFKVTVKPKYNLYEEPYTDWGASLKDISSYMKGNGYELYLQSDDGPLYYGKDSESYIGYVFSDNKLISSIVLLKTDFAEELSYFIDERHVFLGTNNNMVLYLSVNSKNLISVEPQYFLGEFYYCVIYAENTTGDTVEDIFKVQKKISSFLSEQTK